MSGVGIIRESACCLLCRARHKRHTFASRLREAGVDAITRRDLLGHSTVEMSDDYTHSLPENNQRTRHLSFEEEDCLFAALTGAREYLRPLVTVAIYAGPRRGELLKLQWTNVDFDLNIINFTETKTNKDRSVPMEPIVRQALLDLYENAGDAEYVFTNPDTGTRYNDIKKSFSAACREAVITHFTFHDLRQHADSRIMPTPLT